MFKIFFYIIILTVFGVEIDAQSDYSKYLDSLRQEKNTFMRDSADSPFNFKGKVEFTVLNYYKPNTDFVFKSKLTHVSSMDTLKIYGTKGEPRKTIKMGYLSFTYKNKLYNLNVYKGWSKSGEEYYSIWFRDKTSGKTTYYVGRYLDFELNNDPEFTYTIDFNLAYNPYCAYSPNYSCAIPREEDFIPLEITAGEKSFHPEEN